MSDAYVFQPYPKWIYPEGRAPLIVQSLDEEERELGIAPPAAAEPEPDGGEEFRNSILQSVRRGRPRKA